MPDEIRDKDFIYPAALQGEGLRWGWSNCSPYEDRLAFF